MSKIILLCITFFSYTHTHAQTHETDSLNLLLQNEKTDTGRALLLSRLSSRFQESKPDTALTLSFQAMEISTKLGYKKGQAWAFNAMANSYMTLGNYPKAIEGYLKGLKISEDIGDLGLFEVFLANIANFYDAQGNYRLALNYNFKAMAVAERTRQDFSMTLNNTGDTYRNLKMYDSATLYALRAYNMAKQINNALVCGFSLWVLGNTYFETGQYKLALEYCSSSFPYFISTKNNMGLSLANMTTAKIFDSMGRTDSSLVYAKRSFEAAKAGSFTLGIRDASRFLSLHFRKISKDSAYYYQDISIVLNDSLFSRERQRDIQNLESDEKSRQQELLTKSIKDKEERSHNLQYAAIAVAIITFLILFFTLSRSIIVKEKFIEFFGVLGLLAVFEFINLFIHPYLAHFTNHSPVLMLLILIAIGALLVPFHHRLEKWITNRLVEKNKNIRLAAARKTIDTLEV